MNDFVYLNDKYRALEKRFKKLSKKIKKIKKGDKKKLPKIKKNKFNDKIDTDSIVQNKKINENSNNTRREYYQDTYPYASPHDNNLITDIPLHSQKIIIPIPTRNYPDISLRGFDRHQLVKNRTSNNASGFSMQNFGEFSELPYSNPNTNFSNPNFNFSNPNTNFSNPSVNFSNPNFNFSNPNPNFNFPTDPLFSRQDTNNIEQKFNQYVNERKKYAESLRPQRPITPDFSLDGSGERIRQQKIKTMSEFYNSTINNINNVNDADNVNNMNNINNNINNMSNMNNMSNINDVNSVNNMNSVNSMNNMNSANGVNNMNNINNSSCSMTNCVPSHVVTPIQKWIQSQPLLITNESVNSSNDINNSICPKSSVNDPKNSVESTTTEIYDTSANNAHSNDSVNSNVIEIYDIDPDKITNKYSKSKLKQLKKYQKKINL